MSILNNAVNQFMDWCKFRKIPKYVALLGLFLAFLILSTGIHELGHATAATLFGCGSLINNVHFFNGSMLVGVCPLNSLIWIALAGPFASFMFGLLLWFFSHENNVIKMGSYISWFYGTLPNIIPTGYGGSDMNVAVTSGLPFLVGLIIFLGVTTVVASLVAGEIEDTNSTCPVCPTLTESES